MELNEPHSEVRSQLAAIPKRLPGKEALPITQSLLTHDEDMKDPHIPLQICWALENKDILNHREIQVTMIKTEI